MNDLKMRTSRNLRLDPPIYLAPDGRKSGESSAKLIHTTFIPAVFVGAHNGIR